MANSVLNDGKILVARELVPKRQACLQPEKTHSYQYLFAMQLFNFCGDRGWFNKGHLGGLDIDF